MIINKKYAKFRRVTCDVVRFYYTTTIIMKRLFLSLVLIVVAATAMAQYPTEMPKYYIFDKDFNDNLFELNLDVRITTG